MPEINRQVFENNLSLTKAYCDLQLRNNKTDNAMTLRSFNPLYGEKHFFSFDTEGFNNEVEPGVRHCTLTKWMADPTNEESIVDDLFAAQIEHKRQVIRLIDNNTTHEGRILVSQIDCSVIDGASEIQSLGLIDMYDMPPIDTWFYITRSDMTRLLFAWIPEELVKYADEAVQVNCVDCINWADTWYRQEFKRNESGGDEVLTVSLASITGNVHNETSIKTNSLWVRIKQLFGG